MRLLRSMAIIATTWRMAWPALAQISNLPRNQTLIVENPEGTVKNAGWFNIWAINAGGQSTGLHQLAMDTLWYIDPERGIDGVWENSLAAEKPQYNADFTEMTVKLRKGIFWSDGVEFSADDLVYTVETHLKTNGLRWSAPIQVNVASVSAPDSSTLVFKLNNTNSRSIPRPRWPPPRSTTSIPTAAGSSGSCATIGNAPRSRISARRDRNTSPTSIPARPISA